MELTTKLTPDDLNRIADRTLGHYDTRADQFWEGTRDHDVSQNITALLDVIEGTPPFAILDFGLWSGARSEVLCRTRP